MNERKNQNHLERGWAPFRMSEMVQRGESRSRLTDDLKEGKPTMLFNRKHKTGPVMRAGKIALATFLSALLAGNAIAQNQKTVPDVTAMSMEDLMNMQVTSVSKRTQKVADAAAAIFVITQRTYGVRERPAFLKHCDWYPVFRWLGLIRTSGPLARVASTDVSTINCWF